MTENTEQRKQECAYSTTLNGIRVVVDLPGQYPFMVAEDDESVTFDRQGADVLIAQLQDACAWYDGMVDARG